MKLFLEVGAAGLKVWKKSIQKADIGKNLFFTYFCVFKIEALNLAY